MGPRRAARKGVGLGCGLCSMHPAKRAHRALTQTGLLHTSESLVAWQRNRCCREEKCLYRHTEMVEAILSVLLLLWRRGSKTLDGVEMCAALGFRGAVQW
eukprot:256043-Chlamydomonas_euryale.AAC.2